MDETTNLVPVKRVWLGDMMTAALGGAALVALGFGAWYLYSSKSSLKPNLRSAAADEPVMVAARLAREKLGLTMGKAIKAARKAAASMPGHPTGKAIFAEVRLHHRKGSTARKKLGSGSRFKAVVEAIQRRGIPEDRARAIAAAQGRKAYGKRYFAELSQIGKAKAKARRAARRAKR